MRAFRNQRFRCVAVVALALGLTLGVRKTGAVEHSEGALLDLRTRVFANSRDPDPRIVLSVVGDSDVEFLQREAAMPWPWSLEINAAIYELFAETGVAAVLVNVLHLDRGSGPDEYRGDPGDMGPGERARLEVEAASAEVLAAAFRTLKSVSLAFSLTDAPSHELPARVEAVPSLERMGLALHTSGAHGLEKLGADLPIRRLLPAARNIGFVNLPADGDDIIRRYYTVGRWGGRTALSLALAAVVAATNQPVSVTEDHIVVQGHEQRLNADGSFYINLRGTRPGTYPQVAPAQVLEWAISYQDTGDLPEEARKALEGKIIIWGVDLVGARDVTMTSAGVDIPGPELLATALDNLLHGDGRVAVGALTNFLVMLAAGLVLGFAWLVGLGRVGLLAIALLSGAVILASGFLLFREGLVLDLAAPLLGLCLVTAGALVWHAAPAGDAPALSPRPAALELDIIGGTLDQRYVVEERLGAGGMATVYRASDLDTGNNVAIKIPHFGHLVNEGAVQRFQREVRTLADLNHPAIVRVLDQGTAGAVPYLVLEYIQGGSLADHLGVDGAEPQQVGDVLKWLRPLGEALDAIHARGVVHRDVKPENVLVDTTARVFLSDFGLVKALGIEEERLTQTGAGLGSPQYMAPEQARGHSVGPAADQYALATIAYEALCGHPPFTGDTPVEVLLSKIKEDGPPMPPAGVDAAVAAVLAKALSRDPDERYDACMSFVHALAAADTQ